MRARIRGRWWRIEPRETGHPDLIDEDGSRLFGACYWDQRIIVYDASLRGRDLVDTLLHEGMHALNELLHEAEDLVDGGATDLTTILDRHGLIVHPRQTTTPEVC